MKFTDLSLKDELIEALGYMNFEEATPIQEQAIPKILNQKDLIACAQTGTGKTGAFLIPVLNKLVGKSERSTDTLIIVPTRELAIQIEQQIQGLSYFISVSSMAIYGGGDGSSWNDQKDALKNGCDIIVATPGKLLSHIKMGYVNFKQLNHLILDEADRMLDMGFKDDLDRIIRETPKSRQTLLFSATMPKTIEQLAVKILNKPEKIKLAISKPAEGVTQHCYLAFDEQKIKLLQHIINQKPEYDSIIIFTSSKSKVSEIKRELNRAGLKSKGISSMLGQAEREEVLIGFRSKRTRILVATDVMSRGIDIKEINMVINFDCPNDAEDYVHRVGRTARANTKGEAYTLINPKDMHKFRKIEELIERKFDKLQPPEELGAGPEWREGKPKGKRNFKKKKFYKKKPNSK